MKTNMTWDEIAKLETGFSESKIQHLCVAWFRKMFPDYYLNLISVPNGGYRLGKTGAILSYEGLMPGAADLILLVPSEKHHTLCVEMKTPKAKGKSAGRQSDKQKAWQEAVEATGNKYVVCHGLHEFVSAVGDYFGMDKELLLERARNIYFLLG